MRTLELRMHATAHFMHELSTAVQRAARGQPSSTNPAYPGLALRGVRLRRGMSRARASWLVLVALASAVALALAAAGCGRAGRRRLERLGQHAGQPALLAADADRQGQRRSARADLHGRTSARSTRSRGSASSRTRSSIGDRMYVTTGEGKTYALDATSRQGDLEVVPGPDRRLQQGGHRREPRRRGLRRQGLRR